MNEHSVVSIGSRWYTWVLAFFAVLLALAIVFSPSLIARAALLSQVNQAMRDAGIAVTATHQLAWAEGVVVGHYTSFQQLVDAMKWHRLNGRTTPDSSKFTKAITKVVSKKKTAQGTVTSFRAPTGSKAGSITIAGITFRLPKGTKVPAGIQVGSIAKVAYTGSGTVRNGSSVVRGSTASGTATESGGSDDSGDCASCSTPEGDAAAGGESGGT